MRVAFLLTGKSQAYEFCFPSTKKHILDVYHPDIFLCTDTGHDKILDLYQPVDFDIRPSQEITYEAWNLRVAKFGKPEYDLLKDKDLTATWKTLRCKQMMSESSRKYDIVLIGRFDVKYLYIEPIDNMEEDVFYIPYKDAHQQTPGEDGLTYRGYSGQLAWFTPHVSDILVGTMFFGERDYVKESGFKINDEPERLLKFMCDVNGIKRKFFEANMMIIKGTSEHPIAHDFGSLDRFPEYL